MPSFYVRSCPHFMYVHALILCMFMPSFYAICSLLALLFIYVIVEHTFLFIYHYPFAVPTSFIFTCLSFCPFICVFFSLDYFLCTVVSPSTVPISGVPPLFNYPASFILHIPLVITEGRIPQGKSGNLISSPGNGKHSFFLLSVQLRCRIRN
jgi:hypothetical protein